MKNFYLLRKDLVAGLNKRIKWSFISIIIGLVAIYLLSLIPAISAYIKQYLIIIAVIYGIICIAVQFFILYHKADKNPYIMLTFTDWSLVFKRKNGEDEFPIVGLAYVEIDINSFKPGILLTFIYNENKKIEVLIHQKQYDAFVYQTKEFGIHTEQKANEE